MDAEKKLAALKEYIEWRHIQAEADIRMYIKDNGELWKDTDTLVACCRATSNTCSLILEKLRRLDLED